MLHTTDASVRPGHLTALEKQTKTIVRGVYQNPDNNLCPQIAWKFPALTPAWYSQFSPTQVCFPRTEELELCFISGSSMSMPRSTEAFKGSIHVLSSVKAWLVLLTGLLSPVQGSDCADMLQRCELHQDLPDLLVPVLTMAASLWGCRCACKENPSLCPKRGVAGCAAGLMPSALAASPGVNCSL